MNRTPRDHNTSILRHGIVPRFLTLGGANIAAMGLGFAVALLVVRHYGAVGLGELALAQSVVAFLLTVSLWGTDLFAIQVVAARPDRLGSTIALVRWTRALAAATSYIAVLVVVTLVPVFRGVLPLVAILGVSAFVAAFSPEWVPQALHRTRVTAAANLGTQSSYLILTWLLASIGGAGLWGVAAAKAAADLLVGGGLRRWLAKIHPVGGSRPALSNVRAFAAATAPICGAQLLRSIALTSDVVILGIFVNRMDLGHYSGAARIFMLLLALATTYFVIILPRFAERAHSSTTLRDELAFSLRLTVPLAVMGMLTLAVTAAPVLSLLYGADFTVAAGPLRLLGVAAVANLIGRQFRQVLLVRGLQATDLRLTAVGTLSHVASKLVLIPHLGILGAAIGTLVGEAVLLTVHGLAAHDVLRRPRPTGSTPDTMFQ